MSLLQVLSVIAIGVNLLPLVGRASSPSDRAGLRNKLIMAVNVLMIVYAVLVLVLA